MVATPSASKPVTMRAAVLYQAMHLGVPLKEALRDNGVEVVYESTANQLDAERIATEGVQVFVVNLDPDLEEYLDEVTDLLDRFDRPVIFNDANSSASLSGWDQARWARHLSAKIRGELDAHPPRPADAKSIPTPSPTRPTAAASPAPARPAGAAPAPPAATPAAPAPAVASSPVTASPSPVAPASDPFADLDALLGVLGGGSVPSSAAPAAPATPADALDMDAIFGMADPAPAPARNGAGAVNELDALMGALESPERSPQRSAAIDEFETLSFETLDFSAPSSAPVAAQPQELTDLDALFRQLDAGQDKSSQSAAPPPAAPAPAAPAPAAPKIAAKKEAPADWALAPLDDAASSAPRAPAPAPTGRAQFKVDDPMAKAPPPAATPAAKAAAPVAMDGELPALDFDLGDFLVGLAPAPAAAQASSPAAATPADPSPAKPAARDTSAPKSTPPVTPRKDNFPDLGLSADEFEALGFDTITAPSGGSTKAEDLDPLADLDDIFAELDAPPAPAPTRSPGSAAPAARAAANGPSAILADLNRVFVLGASIGGPEAIRGFLAGLKPGVAAGFVLAQHMGAEFIELMAGQLDRASPVRVRVPIDGERFKHGEVIVVPVGKRLTLDPGGNVVMSPPPADSPYSPSIDQVLMDMADRFGPRCSAIIFSGMASDAVEGCKYLHARGGQIWVQDPETCVISSMIDGAQAAGIVSFVGSPEALAQRVLQELKS